MLVNTDKHANTEQLLEIKDGLQNDVSLHVKSCSLCQHELGVLQNLARQLLASADQLPPTRMWGRILQTVCGTDKDKLPTDVMQPRVPLELLVANASQPSKQNSLSTAIYSLAASIMLTGLIGLFIYGQQNSSAQQTALLQANIQELMLNSRGMEQVLQKVAMHNEFLSTEGQSAAERLVWRLTYVDQMIHENNDSNQNDPERVKTLWNERIDALTELSQIYYQRQQTLDDSEI